MGRQDGGEIGPSPHTHCLSAPGCHQVLVKDQILLSNPHTCARELDAAGLVQHSGSLVPVQATRLSGKVSAFPCPGRGRRDVRPASPWQWLVPVKH